MTTLSDDEDFYEERYEDDETEIVERELQSVDIRRPQQKEENVVPQIEKKYTIENLTDDVIILPAWKGEHDGRVLAPECHPATKFLVEVMLKRGENFDIYWNDLLKKFVFMRSKFEMALNEVRVLMLKEKESRVVDSTDDSDIANR